jgi:excisionase family DNA binding protein
VTTTDSSEWPAFLSIDQTAEILGVSTKHLYQQFERGNLPFANRVGATIRVSRDALLKHFGLARGPDDPPFSPAPRPSPRKVGKNVRKRRQ